MLIKSSNMTAMNLFQQEQDESSESQENLKSKLSSFKMIFQQQYKFKIIKIRLKMMKLKVQKFTNQKKLIEKNILFQFLILNEFSVFVYQQDKINIFYKYIAFKASKLIFNLKNKINYNN